jgi:FixJ family two-component response regulator
VLFDAISRALARDAENRAARARLRDARSRFDLLTPREREVFAHLITGQLNKQVAFDLGTSERTIKAHRHSVLAKLEAGSVADLVRLASSLNIDPIAGSSGGPNP